MRTVITYGTFDLLHIGHINLLRRARELGDRLIVGVSTDEFNAKKGKKALQPFEHRKSIVESLRFVDLVVMGNDWESHFDFLKDVCQTLYLPRTPGISSNTARAFLNQNMPLRLGN